jgi:hypothetical protein
MKVEERYEETYWDTDSQGRRTQRTRTGNNTVANNTRSTRFYVEDGNGRILIDPDKAKLDLEQVIDRYEPAQGGSGRLSFGNFSLNLTGGMHSGRRVLGYNYSESILPIGRRIYVIGEASDTRGELTIVKPEDSNKPFIVSLKTEEEVQESIEGTARWLKIGAFALMIIGDVLIVVGIINW